MNVSPGEKKQPEILVVDDDLDLCHVIVDTLTDNGYRATFVDNTEDALKRINERIPDLLLLDLEVPMMGGFVLCQKVHENPATKHLIIIFLTVRDSIIDRKTAMGLGADLYLTKPFRRSVLLREIETLLAKPAQNDDLIGERPKLDSEAPVATAPLQKHASPFESASGILKKKGVGGKKFKLFGGLLLSVLLLWIGIKVFKDGDVIPGISIGPPAVNVIVTEFGPFQDGLNNIGTIKGGTEVELRFQTEGNIKKINFKDGDAVKKGQVIAVLDQTQALIRLNRAQKEYYRYEKLFALGGVNRSKLEEVNDQLSYARAELRKTVIRAVQSGIFGGQDAAVGQFVTPAKQIGSLVSINNVLVSIGVIEKELDKIYPGQNVVVTVEAYLNVEFKGKVETISPIVGQGARTLEVKARIPNEGKLLLPGMFARTRIVTFEHESVLAIPNDAVDKTAEGYQVFVVSPEGKAVAKSIEVSYISLVHSVVKSGLEAGEQVIIQRPQDLKDGSPVKVNEVEKPITDEEASQAQELEGDSP